MERTTLTQTIKSLKGKILMSKNSYVCYDLSMSEKQFLNFRKNIPWLNLWHREENDHQIFTVYFDKLK